jgi:hypothetical protein
MQSLPDRLPLVIGVTGHRDLREQDLPKIEAAVAGIIARLRQDYLVDQETPIIVLSALAEGADRLVARVAMAHGAQLIAALPLPHEEYRHDFEPPSQAELDALLGQAIAAPIMPFGHGNSLQAVRSDPAMRAEQYRAVGLFICRHSHVLIAVWDGDENAPIGGTAEVVKFTREGIPLSVSRSARASLDGGEIGPVIHVEAPRRNEASRVAEVAVVRWGRDLLDHYRGDAVARARDRLGRFVRRLFGIAHPDMRTRLPEKERRALDAWESFEALIKLTREFNSAAGQLAASPRGRAAMARSLDTLVESDDRPAEGQADPKNHPVNDPVHDAVQMALGLAPRWCRMFCLADVLAQDCQARFKRDWQLLFMLTFSAFVCFALFSYQARGLLLTAYSLCYVLIFVVFLRARRERHQERFLDYRALAEAFRVAVFWRLVGIGLKAADADAAGDGSAVDPHTVGVLANACPLKQPSELSWVKECLRTLELLDRAEGIAHERELAPACHAVARSAWVNGQAAFFRRRGLDYDNLAERLEGWAGILLMITAFLLAPLLGIVAFGGAAAPVFLGVDLLLVLGLLPGSAAALTAYSERLALKAQARQYDRMRLLFERACELLPERIEPHTTALVRAVYRELGIEAMRESAEWVAVYRQRPIEPM